MIEPEFMPVLSGLNQQTEPPVSQPIDQSPKERFNKLPKPEISGTLSIIAVTGLITILDKIRGARERVMILFNQTKN